MIIYILLAVSIVLSVVGIVVSVKSKTSTSLSVSDKRDITDSFSSNINAITTALTQAQTISSEALSASIKVFQENMHIHNQIIFGNIF